MGRRDLIRLQEALTSGEVGCHLPAPKINCDGSAGGGGGPHLPLIAGCRREVGLCVSDGCSLLAAAGVPLTEGTCRASKQMKPKAQSTEGHCLLAL